MTAPALFDRYFVEVFSAGFGGGLIAENAEVKLMLNGEDVTVKTLALDYAGFTPGAGHLEITLKNYLSFNPTIDFMAVKNAKAFVTLRIRALSGKILGTVGHISSGVGIDSADGKNTEVDLTITGSPAVFSS
jgi:hypothetical protein